MAQIIVGDRIAKTLAHAMHILETPRLIWREFVVDGADALALVLSDPEAMRFYPAPLDCAASRAASLATSVAMPPTATASGQWS